MSINITSISLSSNTVKTGETFIISVGVEPTTYERLVNWLHSALKKFTYKNLKDDILQ